MNASSGTPTRAGRTRRLTLLAAPPLAALALAIYAFSGLHVAADAGARAVSAASPTAAVAAAPYAAPTSPEPSPTLREHDAELIAYRPHGG